MSAERLSRSTIDSGPDSLMKSNPPTFHHLPQARAKKLKKVWVAKQKTKSKWKAQKRREGILTQRDASSRSADPINAPQSSVGHQEQRKSVDEGESDQHGDESQNSSGDQPALTKSKQKWRGKEEGATATTTGPSLRELQKQAYSPAALHHYKSRPLHHSKGRTAPHSSRTSESSRKMYVGGGTRKPSQRGGQPDMRLRMSAILEKVKRDYS